MSFKARLYPAPAPSTPTAGVWGMVVPDKRASKLLGSLTLGGGGMAASLANDISPGNVFEKFQTEKVSEQSAVLLPPP